MKKFFSIFFMILGIIFFILILSGIYLYIADPFNLKPLFTGGTAITSNEDMVASTTAESTSVLDKHPVLSPKQEAALESLGVDPAALPSSISPEQEACFELVLGASRVAEIKAGATPSAVDVFKARGCLQ